MKLKLDNLVLIILMIFVFIANSQDTHANDVVDCDYIKKYDETNKFKGSLLVWSGCKEITNEIIENEIKEWPESMKLWARMQFKVPSERFPDLKKDKKKIIEMINELKTIDQKILAFEFLHVYNEVYEILKETDLSGRENLDKLLLANIKWSYNLSYINLNQLEIFEIVSLAEVPLYQVREAIMIYNGYIFSADEEKAIAILQEKELENYFDAKKQLSIFYSDKNDYEKAFELEKDLSSENHLYGMYNLARSYDTGSGTEINEHKAQDLFAELAAYNYPLGQMKLGLSYINGWGIEDESLGKIWLKRAAEQLSLGAVDELIQLSIEEKDYNSALYYSLMNSQRGYVTLEDKGYVLSYLLISRVFDEYLTQSRFSKYLYKHCVSNWRVKDLQDCEQIPNSDKDFKNTKLNLTDIFKNIDLIEYTDEFRLNHGKYKALLIGNSEYEFWDNLKTPREDVSDISQILRERYGFETEILFDGNRRSILQAIYDIGNELTFNDHFLLYYAGHGVINNQNDEAYWIPSDATRDTPIDWISSNEIMSSLKSIKTKHLMLIADSCYSGALLRGNAQSLSDWGPGAIERLFSKKAKVALTSGGEEPVSDGGSGKHSVFASALIDVLQESKGPIPASGIYPKLVDKISGKANQTPRYDNLAQLDHDGGDFVFIPKQ